MEDLFGVAQTDSSTFGQWAQVIQPQQTFPLKKGTATIVVDQNPKVSTTSSCIAEDGGGGRGSFLIMSTQGVGELGTRVWNGGLVLARYVERLGEAFFRGKSCIELGSGTGLTGIIAATVHHMLFSSPILLLFFFFFFFFLF